MAERKFWKHHGSFALFSLLVLVSGLYVACSGSVTGGNDFGSDDGGSDAPRSNH